MQRSEANRNSLHLGPFPPRLHCMGPLPILDRFQQKQHSRLSIRNQGHKIEEWLVVPERLIPYDAHQAYVQVDD